MKVALYSVEEVQYRWELEVPDYMRGATADEIWEWANDEELLNFDCCDVTERQNTVGIMKEVPDDTSES